MREEIKNLLELQRVDLELDRIERRKDEIPEEIRILQKQLEDEENKFESFLEELMNLEKKLKQLNLDLEDNEERIRKYMNQLTTLKSNEEYRAIMNQIQLEKDRKAQLEDQIIELMEKIENYKQKRKFLEDDLKTKRNEIRKRIAELEDELIRIDDNILVKRDERKRRAHNVPERLLKQYEKLRQLRGGEVVVPMENGACGGCHAELPIQVQVELKTTGKLIRCEHCGRLIFSPNSE